MPQLKIFIGFFAVYLTIGMFVGYMILDIFYCYSSGLFNDEDTPLKDNDFFIEMTKRISSSERIQMKTLKFFVLKWPIFWIRSGFLSLPFTVAKYLSLKRRVKNKKGKM